MVCASGSGNVDGGCPLMTVPQNLKVRAHGPQGAWGWLPLWMEEMQWPEVGFRGEGLAAP